MAFNYSPKIVTDGLVLCLDAGNPNSYPGSGNTWADLSRGRNNGTLVNGPTFSGDNGGSLVFDGTNDYIDLLSSSDSYNFGLNDFSIVSFIKGTGTDNYRCIFWHHYSPGFSLITNISNGVARFWLGGRVINGNINILDNKWHNVTITRESDIVSIYIDGKFDKNQGGYINSSATPSTPTASIGRYSGNFSNYPFDGYIPQVQIYNRALTPTEILQNYNATKGRFGL